MRTTYKTSLSLSLRAKDLLATLAEAMGISQSAVLEIAIREKAVNAGVSGMVVSTSVIHDGPNMEKPLL